jgi:hypothetical protein
MGRKASWPPKTTVSLRFERQTIYYIDHLIKYLNVKQGMMGTRKITRSVVVEQAIGEYFKSKRDEYANWKPDKLK